MSSTPTSARRMTLRQSLALVWRTLRSMRTALVLLLLLGVAAVAGSLVPQVGTSNARILAMFRDHPLRADIYDKLGLFDVFGSWWFTLIYSLLLISLAACLFPRTRALVRNIRSRPQPSRELDAMRHYAVRPVPAEPERAIADARRVLRRRFFRVAQSNGAGPPALAADKGLAREGGSRLFHWSFFLIRVGMVWGKGTGFTGQAVIVEGQTWTEAAANYDGRINEGRFVDDGDHSGVRIHVEDFTATYRIPSGIPEDFVTHAELYDANGAFLRTVDIRVNHPDVDGPQEGAIRVVQLGVRHEVLRDPRGDPVRRGEILHVDPHTAVVAVVDEAAFVDPSVVVRRRLGPRLSLDDHRLAGEARALAPHHPHQDQEERPVEQEAAALPGQALVRGQGGRAGTVRLSYPEEAPSKHPPGIGDRSFRLCGHGPHGVVAHRIELARGLGARPDVADQGPGSGEQTRGQRDQQERVDEREPPGAEHVEQTELVVDVGPQRVVPEHR